MCWSKSPARLVAAYYDAGLKAHVEAARDEWLESVNAEVEAEVDSDSLDTLKASAQAVIAGSRRSTPRPPRRATKSRSTRRSRTTEADMQALEAAQDAARDKWLIDSDMATSRERRARGAQRTGIPMRGGQEAQGRCSSPSVI
jgi:hypothetical protein